MSNCKTCKWWNYDIDEVVTEFDLETKAYVRLDLGYCRHPVLLKFQERERFSEMKSNDFALDYPVCDLVTGPDFGCNRWEKREA